MTAIKVLEEYINTFNYLIKGEPVYDLLNDRTIYTFCKENDLLFARARLKVTINSTQVEIFEVDHDDNTLTVLGDTANFKEILLPKPFFIHGTPYAVNKKLDLMKNSHSYPIIYLMEIVEENIPQLDSAFSTIPKFRIFFLDEANFKDFDTEQLYSSTVLPQRIFCEEFYERTRRSKLFGLATNIKIVAYAKFGEYFNDKGVLNSIFNKNLSGVELKIDLPIRKNSSCC